MLLMPSEIWSDISGIMLDLSSVGRQYIDRSQDSPLRSRRGQGWLWWRRIEIVIGAGDEGGRELRVVGGHEREEQAVNDTRMQSSSQWFANVARKIVVVDDGRQTVYDNRRATSRSVL